jgi:PAS domain S-box-containing protein
MESDGLGGQYMTGQPRASSFLLLGVFVIAAIGIGAIGYRIYVERKWEAEHDIRKLMATAGDMKVRQVAAWRAERRADAEVVARQAGLMPAVQAVLAGRADRAARRDAQAWLDALRGGSNYANAILTDRRGKLRLASGTISGAASHYADLTREALERGAIVIRDLHRVQDPPSVHMAFNVPLRGPGGGPPAGALLLRIDPGTFLYPLLREWPTPSRSAETILVRREGDEVVVLNELRHQHGAPLTFRRPLANNTTPAARAVLGQEGQLTATDAWGRPVFAYARPIPDSPWHLVIKIDVDEVYERLRHSAALLSLAVASLIAAAGLGVGLLWRGQISRWYRQQYEYEMERRALLGHYDFLARYANDAILLLDEHGHVVECNDRATEMYGYSRQELLGTDIRALRSPPALADFDRQWNHPDAAKGFVYETENIRRGGEVFPVEVSTRLIEMEGRAFRQSIIRDITGRKRLEAQLLQAQKMESVGRLAGGVAHDFNNHLTVINGYAELLLAEGTLDESVRDSVEEIHKASGRAAAVARQLLAFSRKQAAKLEVLDTNATVGEVESMLRRLIGEDIHLELALDPDAGAVLADAGQLHQVLMNLAVNARDAMPGGGTLTIRTARREVDTGLAALHPELAPGPHVAITVADTGMGIDEEVRRHIFEPFFTTKEGGLGTGLGLATVYGIVRQSNGGVWVTSEPGKGSVFEVILPRAEGVASAAGEVSRPAVAGHGETVLVVEDQDDVRRFTGKVLRGAGYRVRETADAEDAQAICASCAGEIDLVVADVVLPGMSGRELGRWLAREWTHVKVLYVSGYSDKVFPRREMEEAGITCLAKPFTPEDLAQKVREILGAG